ncbi:MAG: hypothetical protein ACM3L6_04180 [Deltaproteobacteria bacterium]
MVEPRVTVFWGSEEPAKHRKLALLEKKLFPPALRELNTNVFYADDKELTPAALQEACACLPTQGARQRLVVVRSAHRLTAPVLQVLCAIAQETGPAPCAVLVDVSPPREGEKVVAALTQAGARLERFKSDAAPSVFDLGAAIMDRRPQAALRVLADVLEDRQKPEKLMGALLWQWEKGRKSRRISPQGYQKGLALMAETDRRLKTSSARRQGRLLLELLVVKLSCLA